MAIRVVSNKDGGIIAEIPDEGTFNIILSGGSITLYGMDNGFEVCTRGNLPDCPRNIPAGSAVCVAEAKITAIAYRE